MAVRKKATFTANDLISSYTNYVLEHGKKPSSVYKFCKETGIEETDFYKHYASFETLEAAFFGALHQHTVALLHKNEDYPNYDAAEKLLSYYFTFFEMATANRSYVLTALKNNYHPFENLHQLKDLRKHFLVFVSDVLASKLNMPEERLRKIEGKILEEGAWMQLLFTLKFWMHDSSPNFEKTDVMIEKSVKASFDIIENIPLKSVIDLGKFLWKERSF